MSRSGSDWPLRAAVRRRAWSPCAGDEDWSIARPAGFGASDKSSFGRSRFFGRRSALLAILTTWALLEGAKTATRKSETASADKIQRIRFFIASLPKIGWKNIGVPQWCQEQRCRGETGRVVYSTLV
jgi:hypothetical protein